MKLSEKLAALEEQEGDDAAVNAAKPAKAVTKQAAKRAARAARDGATSSWDDTKRKVRTLVLDEMADRIKTLDAEERERTAHECALRALGLMLEAHDAETQGHTDRVTALALRDGVVPPTLNLDNPSENCVGVDLVPHVAKKRQVKAVLNNSFGFGGTNASLVMKAI